MADQNERDYWGGVRRQQADARRRAASAYEYVPDWVFYSDPGLPTQSPGRPKRKWLLVVAVGLVGLIVYRVFKHVFNL